MPRRLGQVVGPLLDRLAEARLRSRRVSAPACEVAVEESQSPLAYDEEANRTRQEAALALTDPDIYGYVLLTLKKPRGGNNGFLDVAGYVKPEWWPAFILMMARVREAAQRVARK